MTVRLRTAAVASVALAAGCLLAVLAFGSSSQPIAATEGAGFTGTVATMDGISCGSCTATITWGDGGVSAGAVGPATPGGGSPTYPVTGSHTYAEEGAYQVTVVASDGGRTDTTTGPATVADAPLTVSGSGLSAPRGKLVRQAVATFTDADPAGTRTDYSATIDWGDGSAATAGDVENGPAGFVVTGQHAYAAAGTYAAKVTVADAGGASGQAPFQATIAETAKPTARFTLSQEPPIAGQPLTIDASSSSVSEGADPVSYEWTICQGKTVKLDNGVCSPIVTKTGKTIDHVFPFATVHDDQQFQPGKARHRRQTYVVALKVTDQFGRSDVTSRFVTAVADTPPVASFQLEGEGDVMAPRHLVSDSVDVDPQDRIVQEAWDLSGDHLADVICIPGTGCTLGPHAAGLPLYEPAGVPQGLGDLPQRQTISPTQQARLDAKIQNIKVAGKPGIGPPALKQVQVEAAAGQQQRRAGGNPVLQPTAVSPYPKGTVPPYTMLTPDSAPAGTTGFSWNFGDQRLYQTGIERLPDPVGILKLKDGNASQPDFVDFLADYATLAQRYGIARPYLGGYDGKHPSFPSYVTLTVTDRSGATATTRRAIDFLGNDHPQARMRYVHVAQNQPITGGRAIQATLAPDGAPEDGPDLLDLRGTGDKDDPIAYYTLQIGQPAELPCGGAVAFPSMADLFAGHGPVHKSCKLNLGVTDVQRTVVTTSIAGLKTNLPTQAGTYSIALRAFDENGLAGQTRLDGIEIKPTGKCVPLSQAITRKDAKPAETFQVSAACTDNTDIKLVRMPAGVNINGVSLTPLDPAKPLVLDTTVSAQPAIYSQGGGGVRVIADGLSLGTIAGFGKDKGGQFLKFRTGEDRFPVTVAPGAVYRGLAVSPDSLGVQLRPGSASATSFTMVLPLGGATTDRFSIEGVNPAKEGKVNSKVTTGISRRALAHAAATSQIDLPPIQFGPLSLPAFSIAYDDATGTWTGKAEGVTVPGVPATADVTIVIKGGSLVSVTGVVNTAVPLGPGVFADQFSFTVDDEPSLTGSIHVTAAGLLSGSGTLAVHPLVPRLRLDGTLSLGGGPFQIPLGSAFIDTFVAGDGSLTVNFGGQTGADFGPASFHAGVNGGIGGNGYFIEGSGEACLFACLDINAIVSNLGVAACGEIDLWVTSVEAGFGYGFGKPGGPSGLSVWVDSCDIGAFRPVLSTRRAVGGGPGTPVNIPTYVKSADVAVKPGRKLDAITIVAHGLKVGDDAPRITVTGPKGDPRVVTTPELPGEYSFGNVGQLALATPPGERPKGTKLGTTFLDSNPLDHTTTVFVGKPAPGTWKVTVDDRSQPVTKIDYAESLPPIRWGKIDAKVRPADNARGTTGVVAVGASASAAAITPLSHIPVLERKRLRKLTFATVPGTPRLVLIDSGPGGSKVLGATKGDGKDGSITFDPMADGGKHTVRAIALHPNGLPRTARTIATYESPRAPVPARPHIVSVKRAAHSAVLVLDTAPAPTAANDLAFVVLASSSDGTELRLPVLLKDVHRQGSHWAVTLPGIARGAKLELKVAGALEGGFGPKAGITSKAASG